MPFGLTNAPGSFQNGVVSDVYIMIYLDDILIFSGNKDDHYRHVTKVLQQLWRHGLYANGKKYNFHMESVNYLGHPIGPDGLQMDPRSYNIVLNHKKSRTFNLSWVLLISIGDVFAITPILLFC